MYTLPMSSSAAPGRWGLGDIVTVPAYFTGPVEGATEAPVYPASQTALANLHDNLEDEIAALRDAMAKGGGGTLTDWLDNNGTAVAIGGAALLAVVFLMRMR